MPQLSDRENDDATPYKTKYEARELLKVARARLAVELEGADAASAEGKELQEKIAVVDERLGLNYIECEENSEGEKCLKAAIAVLRTYDCLAKYLPVLQEALNSVGILWASREDHKKAKVSLLDSESIYLENKDRLTEDAFGPLEQVEEQYTLTQYYLAQIYGHLGESDAAARCCVTTLVRQLPSQCDREEWATNCMHLSSYYIANADFGRAKHCLDAAVHMMPEETHEESCHADLDIAFGKFCLARLGFGAKDFRERIAREESEEGGDDQVPPPEIEVEAENEVGESMFEACGCAPIRTLQPVVSFEDARVVFKTANPKYERAKAYYELDGFVTNHIAVLQDQSELYRQLAIFERDGERKVKMHRRRAAYLEALPTVLNPSAFEQLYKDVTHELGQIFSEILEIKMCAAACLSFALCSCNLTRISLFSLSYLRAMAENGGKSISDKKVLELVEKSVHHLELFVSSFRWLHGTATTDEDKAEQKRSTLESEESGVLEWFLSAQFLKARLYGKVDTIPYQQRSCAAYEWLTEFGEQRIEGDVFSAELSVAKQMAELLPTKIERM